MNTFIFIILLTLFVVMAIRIPSWFSRLREFFRKLRLGAEAAQIMSSHTEVLLQRLGEATAPQVKRGVSLFEKGGYWDLIGGDGLGWPKDTFYKVRGLVMYQGDLYASLTGPNPDGPCGEVWRQSNGIWSCVGGGSVFKAQGGYSSIEHLFSARGVLLAAERSAVWQFDGNTWLSLSEGLELDLLSGPYCFAEWEGRTTMGQWGRPRVAVLDEGGRWSYLPEPHGGWGRAVRTIYAMLAYKGYLYAATGTGKFSGASSAVWRYDGKVWEQVGGSGIRGSWTRDGIPFVLSLSEFDNRLIATVSRPPGTPAAASNVWVFDGDRWGALAVGATPALMAGSLIMNDAITYFGNLVVATGHGDRQPSGIWELVSGSRWREVGPESLARSGEGDGGWWVYRLCTDGHHLYASTAGHRGAAKIFCFTPN